jgi:hypothetical protein
MPLKPFHECIVQRVTFRGQTRTEAISKLCSWMDENDIKPWLHDSFHIPIDTGYNDTDEEFFAGCMAKLKNVPFSTIAK